VSGHTIYGRKLGCQTTSTFTQPGSSSGCEKSLSFRAVGRRAFVSDPDFASFGLDIDEVGIGQQPGENRGGQGLVLGLQLAPVADALVYADLDRTPSVTVSN